MRLINACPLGAAVGLYTRSLRSTVSRLVKAETQTKGFGGGSMLLGVLAAIASAILFLGCPAFATVPSNAVRRGLHKRT